MSDATAPDDKGGMYSRKSVLLGVCAMAKKTSSKPMREILGRLPKDVFRVVIFDERAILEDPIEDWPVVECLIAFHSAGFPLDKAVAYAALRRPFVVNDLRRQHFLRDRRLVYATLQRAGVPTPRHVALNRDGAGPDTELEEFDDHIVVGGVRVEKPFVEKPVDSDDHNIHIYYPMSAGGGRKRLFRKIGNQSSCYEADEHKVRREGSYLYEEFVDTQGTDVKVYSVGPYYGHAEARKSPSLDGVVLRGADGKELRYPVILSWLEKDLAFKIYHAFRQTVCGFDILRTHDGASLVCDVNGWSFVKKSKKYYDDCAALLAEHLLHRDATRRPPPREAEDARPLDGAAPAARRPSEPACRPPRPRTPDAPARRELRCVIAVIRHGDRTPKRKLKVKTKAPLIVAIHRDRAKTPQKEVKLKESKDLRAFSAALKATLRDEGVDVPPREAQDFLKIREVLKSHRLSAEGDDEESVEKLNAALFSGCKLQLKPVAWEGGEATCVQVVLKWGGVLTELGVDHAAALGAHFRRRIYPESADGHGLLRLHATFRHDLKIRTSDEGRVMKTGAAFTKGLLELEGEMAPVLVSLIHRGRTDVHMLDRAGNHEAQALLDAAKRHAARAFAEDVALRSEASDDDEPEASTSAAAAARRCIAPDGPADVLRALRAVGNPRAALAELRELVEALLESVEAVDADAAPPLYMGETFRVWLDSWQAIRREFYDGDEYDLSKIPEIFDKVRFDERHNAARLGLAGTCPAFPRLVAAARTLSRAVTPLELGGAAEPRRQAAWHVSRALLDKIALDLRTARGADGDASAGLSFRLDDDPRHLAESEIKSSWRAVRSRLYFTSESHLHALLDALRLDGPVPSPVDDRGKKWLGEMPELSYLSHVVFRLWEDPSTLADAPAHYTVEVSVSPGTPLLAGDPGGAGDCPTLPLESFASVPSSTLEAFFSAASAPASPAEDPVARATELYEGLEARLAARARGAA